MPSSPFGLAYGIGAGIAGAQQQMQNRQQAALAMNMQGLQMQALQRQQAEQQALNEALSAQVPQQMSPNTALLNGLPTTPVSPETQASMASNGLPSATAIPNAPTASQMEAINAPQDTRLVKPTEYVTPYQRQAYELSQRAQMLQKKGFGLSAMKLNEQAMQFGQMHQNMALQQAGRAMATGSYQSAVPYLNSVGFDVKSIGIDPDDPGKVAITHSDGSQSLVPKEVASMIAADPTKMAEAMPMIEYRKSLGEAARTRATAYAEGQKSLDEYRKQRNIIAELQVKARALAGNNTSTAFQKNAAFYSHYMKVPISEAIARFTPGHGRDEQTPTQTANLLKTVNAGIKSIYNGNVPDPNSNDPKEQDDYGLYISNLKQIQGLAAGKKTPSQAAPKPVMDINAERKMADAAIAANPTAAEKIKAAYKARTGQDY